jgi:PEGA domain
MRYQLCVFFALFFWAGGLSAGPKEDAANKRKEAEKLFTQGDYNQALSAYDDAHAIFADPSDWLGRAQVLIKLRRFTEANEAYQQFLALGKAGKKQREIERAMEDLSVILQTKIGCSSTPEGATVYLNSRVDDPLGKTPLESNLPPGTHRVIFEKEGFETLVQTIIVEPRSSQTINAELKNAPALLSILASPVSAEIKLNGEVQGMTSLELKLPNGTYELEASATGYPTQRKKIEAKEQQKYTWDIDLTQPPPGILLAQLMPTTAVATINGAVLKQSEALSLPPGTYQASIAAEGYKTQKQEVIIESSQEHTLTAKLEAKGALLQVKANRPDYQLSLDGIPLLLDATQQAVISGGRHQLVADSSRDHCLGWHSASSTRV